MTTSISLHKLGALALAVQVLSVSAAAKPAPTHHIMAIDVSGSMYHDLPKLRQHLKNKLVTMVGEHDLVSFVWFSGRSQFGTLAEAVPVRTLVDLSNLHQAIDRFLTPVGLTGFKEPLNEIQSIIARSTAANPGMLHNMYFMTDGYDNQWTDAEILNVCGQLERVLDSACVVEYGWHCNRPLMAKMAEKLGGELVFSENFEAYAANMSGALGSKTKKVPVKLGAAVSGIVFALDGARLLTFTPDESGVVLVPEHITTIAFETTGKASKVDHATADKHIWGLLSALAQNNRANDVFEVLGAVGDVALVEQFNNCFSKEDYVRFQEAALAGAADSALRYTEGFKAGAVPKADAYTVLEMLQDLASDSENKVYPYHPKFNYTRTGSAMEDRADSAKFKVADESLGYAIDDLVWNDGRPNVNIRLKIDGTVTLPASRPAGTPETVASSIYRNYTVVLDGIVHTRKLPVSLSEGTFYKLKANGLLKGKKWAAGEVYELSYPKLPVINRSMVTAISAESMFKASMELLKLKGSQKVFNDWRNRVAPRTSEKLVGLYGEEVTQILKDYGITDSGFSPLRDRVASEDFYMAKELKVSIKGASSLPKVEVVEAVYDANNTGAAKKVKISEFVMLPAVDAVTKYLCSPEYRADATDANLNAWLTTQANETIAATRALMFDLARQKFALLVSHQWFSDMPTMGEAAMDIELPGFGMVPVTASLKELKVSL